MAVNAPEAGTLKEFLVNEEDTVSVGQDIVKMELGGAPSDGNKAGESPKEPAPEEQKTSSDKGQEKPEPKQDQPSKDEKPSEPTKDSAAETPKPKEEPPAQDQKKPEPRKQEPPSASPPSKPSEAKGKGSEGLLGNREERRVSQFHVSPDFYLPRVLQVKMNRMRLRIAERLKQSQNTAASLTTFNEVDMSSLMEFRKLYKDETLKKTGVKLGFMSAFSRACILAMRDVPAVNASIEGPDGGDTIVYRDYVDISVAVATEKGLVTPVVRNSESLDLIGIERAIAELGKKVSDLEKSFPAALIRSRHAITS